MPIEFEVLVDSPETVGNLALSLPGLEARFAEQADTLRLALPPLVAEFSGAVVARELGTLVATLPPLQVQWWQAAGEGRLVVTLPALALSLRDAGALPVPQSGELSAALPALAFAGTGALHLVGALDLALPALRVLFREDDAGYLLAELPPLQITLLQSVIPTGIVANLVQPSQLLAYAPITQIIQADADVALAAEAAPPRLIANLVAELALQAEASSRAGFRQSAEALLELRAISEVVFRIVAEEAVDWSALAEVSRRQIVTAVAVLEATAVAESRLGAIEQLTAVLTLEALATRGARLAAETDVAFAAELSHTQRMIQDAIEACVFEAEATMAARFVILAEASWVPSAEASSLARMVEAVEAGFVVTASFRLGNETYVCWVLNTETDAASVYTGYHYNSFAPFDDRYFALGSDGLYELAGPDDDGDPISWRVRSGLIDFGTRQLKAVPMMWLAWSTSGAAWLKVTATSPKGRKETHWYTIGGERTAEALREDYCPIGKGLESVFFQFTLEAIDGAPADVDGLQYVPLKTGRRA